MVKRRHTLTMNNILIILMEEDVGEKKLLEHHLITMEKQEQVMFMKLFDLTEL